jgi:benzoyl-CoA reductase/2-hydroxyglutaryl-CoA dehydratase subunit BcrC/BadD/HgdB
MTEKKWPDKYPIEGRRGRRYATVASTKVGPMMKEAIGGVVEAEKQGKSIAYSFIQSNHDEILRAMDIVPMWTENYAGICGAKRDTGRFLEKAESLDFSRSLCTYATCGLGFDAWREESGDMPPDSPWGGQVKPDVMLSSGQIICDPRNKWYQACKQFMPDVPVHNSASLCPLYEDDIDRSEVEGYYVKYITEDLKDLVGFLERHLNKKMDWDRLWRTIDLADRTMDLLDECRELRKAVPTPMDTGDAMNTMVAHCFMLGTQQAYDFLSDLQDELRYKVERKLGVVPGEKYRLAWAGGLPSWFALTDFMYFWSKGAVFPVESTYNDIAYPVSELDLPKTDDPLEYIAWRWIRRQTYWWDAAKKRRGSDPEVERIIHYIEKYKIDGLVVHEAFSCRSWHVGLLWMLNQIAKIYKPIPVLVIKGGKKERTERELPSLVLESDIVDISSYSEADTHARIDAFIETVESVKSQKVEV